ncbi:MAG: OsmC family protein [Candidatus Thiodiazotropha sp. (ex Myrtea sp. 'scaly one' KF741663)]|nr:OsmC family protein [Candidatus Thiodiazotropha sp. (ex Myrtea sp. 'scaly one' KF741663)]
MNTQTQLNVRDRQAPLQKRYLVNPEEALINDQARTSGGVDTDPFHGTVHPGKPDTSVPLHFGIHSAVGGYHDAPNPGDMLCAALAACLDSTLRIIADRLGVKIQSLEVVVAAKIDVRGTLMVDRKVQVGFQQMKCHIDIQADDQTDPKLMKKLIAAAEHSCVNLQTLRTGVPVETSVNIG